MENSLYAAPDLKLVNKLWKCLASTPYQNACVSVITFYIAFNQYRQASCDEVCEDIRENWDKVAAALVCGTNEQDALKRLLGRYKK